MPFEVKIRPVDFDVSGEEARCEFLAKSAMKLRFKRLFERQLMKASLLDKVAGSQELNSSIRKDGFEPSSVCLVNMVENYMEGRNEKPRCGRNGCKCGGKCIDIDSSDNEFDPCSCFGDSDHSSADACENLKSLVPCKSVTERNLLADTARIVDQQRITKQKDDVCLSIVTDGLKALGYNTSVCKTHWEKTSTCPAGEYEYVDIVIGGERLIVDIDFKSQFEVARATKSYKSILLTLPLIFVGKSDRLQRIASIVAEAAKQSLKKKGMPLPPWRKSDYVKAKWLSAYTRVTPTGEHRHESMNANVELPNESLISKELSGLESGSTLGEESSGVVIEGNAGDCLLLANSLDKNEKQDMVTKMEQLETNYKHCQIATKKIGGLTCIIGDKP